ncbi:MAG TPA: AAA family ATPase [Tepidisphaeraceae bacterium]|jgi:pilus assembly protein CpaE
MYIQLNSVIIDGDNANRNELANFLSSFGVTPTGLLPSAEGLPALLARPDAPQLVIVNLDPAAHDNLKKLGNMPRQFPNVSFFVMSQTLDANLLMEAMHQGVKEFIPLPISEQKFGESLERVASTHGMGKRCKKLIHVIPTIGGCGSTTLACNIATSLAQKNKTALLDFDLIRGGVASYFDVRPRYTLSDVMESADKVDKQLLDNALVVHQKSQLAILARPDQPEDSQRVDQPGTVRLMGVLGRMYDYIVIDSMMSIDPLYMTTLQAADENLIVMQLNVPSAKNAERFVGAMRRMGIDQNKIRIVVNRYVKKGADIEPSEVEKALGLKISWMIPNDFKNAIAAINYGEPVVLRAPRTEISTSLVALADQIAGKEIPKSNAA